MGVENGHLSISGHYVVAILVIGNDGVLALSEYLDLDVLAALILIEGSHEPLDVLVHCDAFLLLVEP